jgi:hypothetical protein
LKQSISAPVPSSRQLFLEAAGLNSIVFPVVETPPLSMREERNGRRRRIERLSMSRLKIAHLSIDVIKLGFPKVVMATELREAEMAHLD